MSARSSPATGTSRSRDGARRRAYVLNALGGASALGYPDGHRGAWRRSPGHTGAADLGTTAASQFTATPGQVAFTPDGSQLLRDHEGLDECRGRFRRPGRRAAFAVAEAANSIPGDVPFAVAFDRAGHTVVTETGPNAVATFTLSRSSKLTQLDVADTGQMATCWVVGQAGRCFYASNAGDVSRVQRRLVWRPDGAREHHDQRRDRGRGLHRGRRRLRADRRGGHRRRVWPYRPAAHGSVTVPGGVGGEAIAASWGCVNAWMSGAGREAAVGPPPAFVLSGAAGAAGDPAGGTLPAMDAERVVAAAPAGWRRAGVPPSAITGLSSGSRSRSCRARRSPRKSSRTRGWRCSVGLGRFEERSSLRTWLFTILVNRARGGVCAEARSVPVGHAPGRSWTRPASGRRGRGGTAPSTGQKRRRTASTRLNFPDCSRVGLDSLPARQREVVLLREESLTTRKYAKCWRSAKATSGFCCTAGGASSGSCSNRNWGAVGGYQFLVRLAAAPAPFAWACVPAGRRTGDGLPGGDAVGGRPAPVSKRTLPTARTAPSTWPRSARRSASIAGRVTPEDLTPAMRTDLTDLYRHWRAEG